MKKTISTLVVTAFLAGTILTGCQSSATKAEKAQENVTEANQELDQAVKDSIQQFRTESEGIIRNYEKNIAELKVKIAKEKKEAKAESEKRLAVLEQKNNDMKKKLGEFNAERKEDWSAFKRDFKHDMDELGDALVHFYNLP